MHNNLLKITSLFGLKYKEKLSSEISLIWNNKAIDNIKSCFFVFFKASKVYSNNNLLFILFLLLNSLYIKSK